MACDICGNNSKPLTDLREIYQTREIKQICTDCETVVNKKNSELLTFVLKLRSSWLKKFMEERKITK